MASGFHICIRGNTQADPTHEEKQSKFKAVQRASFLIPLEEHKGAMLRCSGWRRKAQQGCEDVSYVSTSWCIPDF